MGLYASVDIFSDLQFIPMTPVLGLIPKYNPGCEIFCSVFENVSKQLCPVDTGRLQASLKAETDGMTYCEAITDCEYAQYQEYGTWCMPAQPYFEIAVETAINSAFDSWKEAEIEAFEEEQNILRGYQRQFLYLASSAYREGDSEKHTGQSKERDSIRWADYAEITYQQILKLYERLDEVTNNNPRDSWADVSATKMEQAEIMDQIDELWERWEYETDTSLDYFMQAVEHYMLAAVSYMEGDLNTEQAMAMGQAISVSQQIQEYGGMFSPPTTLIE